MVLRVQTISVSIGICFSAFFKNKTDFSTDLGMFFFAALGFAGENFKAETSSNFSKGGIQI